MSDQATTRSWRVLWRPWADPAHRYVARCARCSEPVATAMNRKSAVWAADNAGHECYGGLA